MYRAWGGDCSHLGSPEDAIEKLWHEYTTHGAPKFPTEPDRMRYLRVLFACRGHIDLVGNDLEPEYTAKLRELLDILDNDLKP